jgi:hypothetical protein
MGTKTIPVETVAQGLLEPLRERRIEVFLANAGTDFASLMLEQIKARGLPELWELGSVLGIPY